VAVPDPVTVVGGQPVLTATVVGPSLTYADACATAAFVLGRDAIRWIDGIDGYAALVVDGDGTCTTSSRWAEWTR